MSYTDSRGYTYTQRTTITHHRESSSKASQYSYETRSSDYYTGSNSNMSGRSSSSGQGYGSRGSGGEQSVKYRDSAEGMLEGMEMDRSTSNYQFPLVPQPSLQQPPGLLPIYNQMESNQLLDSPELTGSPASLYSHHSASRTGSPQNAGAVSPPYPSHQSMTPLQHMPQPMYPLSMPIQSMGSIPQMSPPHDISLQQNSSFQNTYTQDWSFPGSAGPIWDQTVAFRPMSTYAVPMTMGMS